jgi:hypothetical protein
MLLNLVSWLLLTVSAAMVGSTILSTVRCPGFRHFGDQFIIATWLGLLTFATALLGVSIFLPLRPGISFILLGSMTALAASITRARDLLKFSRIGRTNFVFVGIGNLAAIAALSSTRLVQAYDTGLYHYQMVRWLSEYGTVPGLALIHFRFGFSSSWFALAAPFDFGPIQGRISGLFGGLAIFLALLHFALAISRIIQHRAERADWFLAGGYPLIFLVCFSWAFEVSLSPDLPIWILTLIIGWLMIVEGRPEVSRGMNSEWNHNSILPLILAFAAMSIKLSAAPLVVVAGLFFLLNSVGKLKAAFVPGAIASLLVVPLFAANIASSGCPLFPGTLMCSDLPWSVGKASAQVSATGILNWARWGGEQIPPGATEWSWIPGWFSQRDKLMLLSLCFACLVGFLIFRGWRKGRPFLWVLSLSLAGMAFVFINAPNPRFGAGYLALCPALFAAVAGPDLETWAKGRFSNWFEPSHSISLAPILLGIGALLALQAGLNDLKVMRKIKEFGKSQMESESHSWHRLLLPPALPKIPGDIMVIENRRLDRIESVQLASERSNGIEYWRSLGTDQCWGASLPCLPDLIEGDVRLRRPTEGLRSGFIKSPNLPNNASAFE